MPNVENIKFKKIPHRFDRGHRSNATAIKHDFNRGKTETHVSSITCNFCRVIDSSATFDEDLWLNYLWHLQRFNGRRFMKCSLRNDARWLHHISRIRSDEWHISLRLKLIPFSHEKWWSNQFHEPLPFIQTIQFNLVIVSCANSSAALTHTLFRQKDFIFLTIKFAGWEHDKQTI